MPIPINGAHWHIVLAHIPALLYIVSAAILLLATLWKDGRWQRVALGFIVAATLCTTVVFSFGEDAEHIIEAQPDAANMERYIHPHEELAETARNVIIPFGILVLLMWWFTRKHALLPSWAAWGVVVVTLVIFVLLTNVGAAGGKVNHPEVRGADAGQMWDDKGGERDKDDD